VLVVSGKQFLFYLFGARKRLNLLLSIEYLLQKVIKESMDRKFYIISLFFSLNNLYSFSVTQIDIR